MTDTKPIRQIAIIGTGVIGASWTAQYLAKGLRVTATDVAPNAEIALRQFVKKAWPALERLGLSPGASQSNLRFTADLAEALASAERDARAAGRTLALFGHVCGTYGDPQDRAAQIQRLQAAGAMVVGSNFEAAVLAAELATDVATELATKIATKQAPRITR